MCMICKWESKWFPIYIPDTRNQAQISIWCKWDTNPKLKAANKREIFINSSQQTDMNWLKSIISYLDGEILIKELSLWY